MACLHRFHEILIPQQNNLRFLFIGTFNPSWDAANANNANYFYGRASSLFWCILPHAFNQNCLIDKERPEWEEFCVNHQIGISDIISSVTNADQNNAEHIELLTLGFQDKNLDKRLNREFVFEHDFTTERLLHLIGANRQTLRGVFFTRSTKAEIPRIWNQWENISRHCRQLNIPATALPTPSTRGGTIRERIFTWRRAIQNCM